ncbi:MAG: hypothetical protein GW855_04255 [Erythrobacter sp.]|nr:hypothetical protein [Erythrobacter sp.]
MPHHGPSLYLVDDDEREIAGTRRAIRPTMSSERIAAIANELRAMMGEATFLRERLPDGEIRRLD